MSEIKMFQTTSRIIRGNESLLKVKNEVARLGKSQVMIVTDPGIVSAGISAKLEKVLQEAKISYTVFDQVEPDPQLQTAVNAKNKIVETGADIIIGMGGGSPIDIAKVSAVLATSSGDIHDLIGIDQVGKAGLPTIIIPTTAGTGSEVTPIAILSDHEDKLKKGIVSPYLFPAVAVLDAQLTVGLPPQVTAATGMDALIHAVEAYTSKNADSFTDLLAEKAMVLIRDNICEAYQNGANLLARQNMLEGSMLAGMAFANAGVTAVHAFAYPIGAGFHIPHGVANSIMLMPVMEFNLDAIAGRFARISELFGFTSEGLTETQKAGLVLDELRRLKESLNIPKKLRDFGIKDEHIAGLAQGVMKVTRLLANNPKELTEADAAAIYRKVL
jgi:alcohol dehydrogenase